MLTCRAAQQPQCAPLKPAGKALEPPVRLRIVLRRRPVTALLQPPHSTEAGGAALAKTAPPGRALCGLDAAAMQLDKETYHNTLQVVKGFCAKADGKDKLTALIQYACLFASAGEPGNLKKVQASVTAARKVFRVMRPLESLTPLLLQPGLQGKQAWQLEAIAKLKDLLMAIYFAADHVVWAYQIGLVSNKTTGERAQKVSLYGWALGSVCTVVLETAAILEAAAPRRPGEGDAEWAKRQDAARKEVNGRLLVLLHALVQAGTAVGLLQLVKMKPRTVGFLGMAASAINCYFLLPPFPKRAVAPAAAPAAAAGGGIQLPALDGAGGKLVAKVA